MGDLRVVLGQAVLVLREVVELAIVRLSVPMLLAKYVGALAWNLNYADLFRALPALIRIRLSEEKKLRDC